MNKAFPERRDVVDGSIAALVAAENVLLLGPPGTAKTKLIEVLADATGMSRFTHLMTQFTDPSEIFGGLDVAAAKVGIRRTITTGMLPEVQIGILDEIFKSNSAILNALLTIINERKFHNGAETIHAPLNSIFAASNEMPQTDDLAALFDRLFLRFEVDYLRSDANFLTVIADGNPKPSIKLSPDVISAAQAGASSVRVTTEASQALLNIRTSLKAENVIVSDRRWVKAYGFAKSVAWLDGDDEVTPEHLGFLADALWSDPDQKSTVKRIVAMHTNSVAAKALEITAAANEQVDAVQKLAAYDRSGALNAASQANTKIAAMLAKLDEMKSSATKKQIPAIEKARTEVEAAKAAIVAIVKKG
jgi:MoxR-like ATPase